MSKPSPFDLNKELICDSDDSFTGSEISSDEFPPENMTLVIRDESQPRSKPNVSQWGTKPDSSIQPTKNGISILNRGIKHTLLFDLQKKTNYFQIFCANALNSNLGKCKFSQIPKLFRHEIETAQKAGEEREVKMTVG